MNLKYYLRGLGIGIVVTALIMGITAAGKDKSLSDSEIIERAKALGMTEESTLLADAAEDGLQTEEEKPANENGGADSKQEPEAAMAATAVPEATAEAAMVSEATPESAAATPVVEATAKPTAAPTAVPTPAPSPEPTAQPSPSVTPTPVKESTQELEGITIQINSGDGSYTVCKKLEEAGLVDSASDFDTYLCENGYDKRINVGTFTIPEGAEPDQIAKILARME